MPSDRRSSSLGRAEGEKTDASTPQLNTRERDAGAPSRRKLERSSLESASTISARRTNHR